MIHESPTGEVMRIEPPLRSRLIAAAAGGVSAILIFGITGYAVIWQHEALGAIGLVLVAVLALSAYYWGRSAILMADRTTVVYIPPLGKTRGCSRQELGAIDRVPGLKGTYQIRFKRPDGSVLLALDHNYARADITRLADYLGVSLEWDADWPR